MAPTRFASAVLLLAIPFSIAVLRVRHHAEHDNAVLDTSNNAEFSLVGHHEKQIIGPVAELQESDSGLSFIARVDTGAKRTSLHATSYTVIDGTENMIENVGKKIRILLENRQGESTWMESTVADVALIRTSEQAELRYLVPMKFLYEGFEREVLVSLNDRSQMQYAMLLGRNYLKGKFVVDVSDESSPTETTTQQSMLAQR